MKYRAIPSLAVLLLFMGVAGCANPRRHQNAVEFTRAGLDGRVARVFTNAVLFKPKPADPESLASKLAPLILWEQGDNRVQPPGDRFRAGNAPSPDAVRPTLYASEGEILVHGRRHVQLTYLWFHPLNSHPPAIAPVQGVRMTLNSAGAPVIWEVLWPDDRSGRLFFVAESLEKAAAAEAGHPLPGRRFATEPSVRVHPSVVVARALDDGPIPMGPMVYVEARTALVSTVLCRCMPVQVARVTASLEYDLLRSEGLLAALPETLPLGQLPGVADLESCLRLPSAF